MDTAGTQNDLTPDFSSHLVHLAAVNGCDTMFRLECVGHPSGTCHVWGKCGWEFTNQDVLRGEWPQNCWPAPARIVWGQNADGFPSVFYDGTDPEYDLPAADHVLHASVADGTFPDFRFECVGHPADGCNIKETCDHFGVYDLMCGDWPEDVWTAPARMVFEHDGASIVYAGPLPESPRSSQEAS